MRRELAGNGRSGTQVAEMVSGQRYEDIGRYCKMCIACIRVQDDILWIRFLIIFFQLTIPWK
jgi:hypothetical protein